MKLLRRSNERGHADHGWLDSHHTFSFADYHDPNFMGFGSLRVINDDRVAPGRGFGTHPHRDMEIISYVIQGKLEHKDSMGNGSIIEPGDVQRMSAGTGVSHSEFNPSTDDPVHFLQLWIIPERLGLPPSYEQKNFAEDRTDRLCLVVSPDGRAGSLKVHQDVDLYASQLKAQSVVSHDIAAERIVWVQVISGRVQVNDDELEAGDGLALAEENRVTIVAEEDAHFLLFDLKAAAA